MSKQIQATKPEFSDSEKCLHELEVVLGVSGLYPLRELSESKRLELKVALGVLDLKELLKNSKVADQNLGLFLQTLAVLHLTAGASFPEGLKEDAISSATADVWFDNNPLRLKAIHEFVSAVKAHNDALPQPHVLGENSLVTIITKKVDNASS